MSAGRTFLLEVGCEEIPAAMVLPALTDLSARLLAAVGGDGAAGGLGGRCETPPPFGGPRRLVAVIAGLRDREEDRLVTVTGPPVAVAFDAAGQPTKAALGFAKAQGVDPGALRRVAGEKGEVVGLEKKIHGRAAVDVLSAACPKVLSEMRFPKMMKWGDKGHMFVRPVHWIVALLDGEIVPFEFLGVPSGRATTGHRFLSPGPLDIPSAQEYEQVLATRGKVLARNTARRERIVAERSAAAASMGWSAREDEALLAELTFLNEYPSVIAGTFAEEFLSLEEPFIVTPMRHHQKYFPASRPDGSLAPGFLAVINTEAGRSEAIRRGNEWVLRARLADARFFREEDRKRRLSDRLPDLARIAFHERLGDTLQRSQRLERLARWLSAALDLPGDLA
ncbi:MAG TPA: glycine--tRNA ligase subunit beta, partial [Candidatus Polarisedimenticolia bacterium]|nr:glycine--tRNA ligase subunit beta [Candidatus Polarisedimenticolia bacterium]